MSTHKKISVALSSVFASGGLTIGKLVIGLVTGSLGILSEAIHSLLDFGAALLTYFAVKISDEPADKAHPYGHGKVESVTALIETGLLFLTSGWVIYEAVLRLLVSETKVEVTWYAIAIVLISIAVDFFRSRALMKVAKETKSQALEADALHFSSDIWSSFAVLLGLIGVSFGFPQADAIGALIVAGFVAHVGWQLGKRTINVLIDVAPEGISERVLELAEKVSGVVAVRNVRARLAGKVIFAEVEISVSHTLPLEKVESIANEVKMTLLTEIPDIEASVRAIPISLSVESVAERVRMAALSHGLSAHHIGVYEFSGTTCISFDLEVDAQLTIQKAHEYADSVEEMLKKELGNQVFIDIHIDPFRKSITEGIAIDDAELSASVNEKIISLLKAFPSITEFHELHVRTTETGLYVSAHMLFPPNLPLIEVHDTIELLEFRLRQILSAAKVTLHAEPKEIITL